MCIREKSEFIIDFADPRPLCQKAHMMKTLSEIDFVPNIKKDSFITNTFVDISNLKNKKILIN